MDRPDGFQIKGQERKVCRLKKSLYGLKEIFKTMVFEVPSGDIGYWLWDESSGSLCLCLEG